jgi:hypothetical protein
MVHRRCARPALAAFSFVMLAACAGGGAAHPAGWTQASDGLWTRGDQVYRTQTKPFSGTLKELASQETIDAVLRDPTLHLVKIVPYPDCPGLGGLMLFSGTGAAAHAASGPLTLLEGFVIRDSQATLITYSRPAALPADAGALRAMRSAICHETI